MTDFSKDMLSSFTTLIFDLDGTLLDSMGVWSEVDEAFLGSRGFEVTDEYVAGIKCRSIYQGALFTIDMFGLDETPEAVIAEWESMVEKSYANEILLKDGVKELLTDAHNMGLKICCATASSRKNSEAALQNNGVLQYFDTLMTLDDFGETVNKNNPDIYLKAMEAVGETDTSRCLVFEDVLSAIKGAKKADFKTAIVYDELNWKDFEEGATVADYRIRNWLNV